MQNHGYTDSNLSDFHFLQPSLNTMRSESNYSVKVYNFDSNYLVNANSDDSDVMMNDYNNISSSEEVKFDENSQDVLAEKLQVESLKTVKEIVYSPPTTSTTKQPPLTPVTPSTYLPAIPSQSETDIQSLLSATATDVSPFAVASNKIIKSAILSKKCKGFLWDSYKLHLFELYENGNFVYYENDGAKVIKGRMKINASSYIERRGDIAEFVVHSKSRKWFLLCNSKNGKEEALQWIDALNKIIWETRKREYLSKKEKIGGYSLEDYEEEIFGSDDGNNNEQYCCSTVSRHWY